MRATCLVQLVKSIFLNMWNEALKWLDMLKIEIKRKVQIKLIQQLEMPYEI
jgi:hypothetical protein